MYDWNKDGKIDMVDHWISHQIINYEKEKERMAQLALALLINLLTLII